MKNIVLCILVLMPTLGLAQSFEGLLHRLIIDRPMLLDLKASYEAWSKMKLADKKIIGINLYGNCKKSLKEVVIELKLNSSTSVHKLACDEGYFNSLGQHIYIPIPKTVYGQIQKLELNIKGPMLLRWSELLFDKIYNYDLAGKTFSEKIRTLDQGSQRDLYSYSPISMDTVDERMFSLRMLASYPSVESLKVLQTRYIYDGDFINYDLKKWAKVNTESIYNQLMSQAGEEEVAKVFFEMHDFNEFSYPGHELIVPVLKNFKSAAGLAYALYSSRGYLPDPGLDLILAKKDAAVYVEKQKEIILERVFSEFNELEYLKNEACEVFTRFPQIGLFNVLFNEKDNIYCIQALNSILTKKSIKNELVPHLSQLKSMLAIHPYSDADTFMALLAFLQIKSPDILPQVKLIAESTKVRAETSQLAKRVLEAYGAN